MRKDIERRYRSGERIVERGSAGRELFILHEGTVLLEEEPPAPARLLGPGDLFGESAAILGRPHCAQATAEGDVVVLGIDVPTLHRLCTESSEFAVRIIRHLALRAERAVSSPDWIADAEPEPEPERPGALSQPPGTHLDSAFAAALLRCAHGDDAPVPVRGRLAQLAGEAGIEVIEAYGCLQRLLDRHVLRLVDDQLSILQLDELRALAGRRAA
jgi:CRP-like cAMP-binding protein